MLGLLVAVFAGGGAIYKEAVASKPDGIQVVLLGASLTASLFLGGVKIAQSRHKDVRDDRKESPEELRGCLYVIHHAVAGHKGVKNKPAGWMGQGWMRVTLHRVFDQETLEQSVDYVGSEDGGAGRKFKIRSGFIGNAARTKKPVAFDRKKSMPFEDWVTYLVDKQGMTQAEAEKTRKDRFAFLGVPIKSPGGNDVRAVVYLDAAEPGFFDPDTMAVIVNGCGGLAAWVNDRYYQA